MTRAAYFVLLAPFTAPAVARADDGWWSTAGGIGSYGKGHPSIRMVSEDLKIHLVDDLKAKVDVLFTFRNEGKAAQVTMAFPESYQSRVGSSLEHFRTWVDGKRVVAHRKIITNGNSNSPDKLDEVVNAVWLKRVRFAANQTLKVRVAYQGYLSGNTSGDRFFNYMLTTGSTWKGPIGGCKVTVTWKKRKDLCAPHLSLLPAKWRYLSAREAVTTLTNWEPEHNLEIERVPGFGNFWINGKHLPGHESKGACHTAVIGSVGDPMIRTESLEAFFGGRKADENWGTRWFGGPFTISKGTLTLHSGRSINLPRGHKVVRTSWRADMTEEGEFVYLRDVVKALGGKFKYNAAFERVEITFG